MRLSPPSSLAAFTLLVPLVGSTTALALRHDVEEEEYLAFGREFPSVVQVGGLASGVLVAPDWVLTVAHAPEMMERMRPDEALSVEVGGETIAVERVVVPEEREAEPGLHDIALLRLAASAPEELAPIDLWLDAVEPGTRFVIAGHGILATGDEGIELSPQAMASPTRRLRAGRNVVEEVDAEARQFTARFDEPKHAVELEAGPCIGDSGGPALYLQEGEEDEPDTWHVLGVIAAIDDTDGDRVLGEYGEEFAMTSVPGYAAWIRATMEE